MRTMSVGAIGGGLLPEQWGLPYEKIEMETPFGRPSAPVARTELADGKTVHSILRHGKGHAAGSAVNYRANVAALHQLGCDVVVSLCLAGTLVDRFDVGDVVVYDDVLDFRKSSCSFFSQTEAVHCAMAPLVSPAILDQLGDISAAAGCAFRATMVVIEGPRYSTHAESRMYANLGGDLICQTVAPECFLVREKQMDWFGICLVTDRDTRDRSALVNTGLIYENMNRHKDRYAATLLRIFEGLKLSDRLEATVEHAVPRSELTECRDD
jgi:5'-methylthioadenosine phosphorylase